MSISNELSSDVAAAILAADKDESAHDATELAEMVLEVHSVLRRLTAEGRRKTRVVRSPHDEPHTGSAATGRH